jgi:hypothetical protein
MLQKGKYLSPVTGLLALLIMAPALGGSLNKSINLGDNSENDGQSSVNGSISVGDNAIVNGSLDTVNGTIRIGQNTKIGGDADTVNGSIRIDSGSSVDDVDSVNGSIRIAEKVTVAGKIDVVNGKISLANGTTVADGVSNVNGEIEIAGAEVGGNLSTVNGDVSLSDQATLRGDLVVEKPGGWNWNNNSRMPKVIIGPGSTVVGQIVLEREVELFISESAEVGGVRGEMSIDDAVRFSGERP